jgi:CBS domain-containing protein
MDSFSWKLIATWDLRRADMKVQDILKTKGAELVTIGQQDSLGEAYRLLSEHNIGVLLVTNEQNKPVGIISERDLVHEFANRGPAVETTIVQEAMTEDLIIGVPEDDLQYVMNVMTQQRIRHLPILDGDELAGLISIGDVVKSHMNQAEAEIRYLNSYITGTPTG